MKSCISDLKLYKYQEKKGNLYFKCILFQLFRIHIVNLRTVLRHWVDEQFYIL